MLDNTTPKILCYKTKTVIKQLPIPVPFALVVYELVANSALHASLAMSSYIYIYIYINKVRFNSLQMAKSRPKNRFVGQREHGLQVSEKNCTYTTVCCLIVQYSYYTIKNYLRTRLKEALKQMAKR